MVNNERRSGYELAEVYSAIEDYSNSTSLIIKEGIDGYEGKSYELLNYALFKTNINLFRKKIQEAIAECKQHIIDDQDDDEDWEDSADGEREEYLNELEEDIKYFEELENFFNKSIPSVNLEPFEEFPVECLMFDCPEHNTPFSDNI